MAKSQKYPSCDISTPRRMDENATVSAVILIMIVVRSDLCVGVVVSAMYAMTVPVKSPILPQILDISPAIIITPDQCRGRERYERY